MAEAQICEPGAVLNGDDDPWSWQCYLNQSCLEQGNPCTANDVTLTGAYLADEFGNPIIACQAGQPVQAYLWGLFSCNAANRYAVQAYTEVYLDGVFSTYLNSCAFDNMLAGQSSYALLGIINYTCGQQFSLQNTWVAWDTNASQCSDPLAPNYNSTCKPYPASKCSKDLGLIEFLSPNFYYECGVFTDTTREICFTDTTTGGLPPYTYSWDFGDGGISTAQNPCHVYNAVSGLYNITLYVTDAEGVTAGVIQTLDLGNIICPEPALTVSKVADQASFSAVGEVVTYTITATNSGNTYLNNVVVTDNLVTPNTVTCPVLAPSETCVLIGTYTITQADLDACLVTNIASATAVEPTGSTITATDFTLQLPAANCTAALSLIKEADQLVCARIGDVIDYIVTATNSGTVTLSNVTVSDPLLTPSSASCAALLPGETCVLLGSYMITAADAITGQFANTATASGTGANGSPASAEASATVTTCDDNDLCTVDTCDPLTGECVYTPKDCDDSDACTTDSCDPLTGDCVHTAIDCDDSDACTTDTCDPATGCVHTPVDCDDNDACTTDTCDPATGCVYTPVDCDDNDACTTDTCDPLTGCVHTPVDCDDNDACTTDTCDPLTGCVHTTVDCSDGVECTVDTCDPATGCVNTPDDTLCDDNDACTTDVCDPLLGCVYTPVDCDDNDACTTDTCDPVTGCVYTPVDCDDNDACTTDTCDPATGCIYTPVDCGDGVECTVDTCDPATGCVNTPDDTLCDDNDACTTDVCDPVWG